MSDNNNNNDHALVGISGKAGAGKDTLAHHLVLHHGYSRIAFADAVKLAAQQVFGLSEAQTWDDSLKGQVITYWGLTPRQMFQRLGEALKAEFGQDLWVKRWDMSYNMLRDSGNVVCPDARFDLEAAHIKDLGGSLIEVTRPGAGLTGLEGAHVSERGLQDVEPDVVLVNAGSRQELINSLDVVIREFDK